MLTHIIPCCRKDKSKRDYIEQLLKKPDLDEDTIKAIEDQIKFDHVKAPSTDAIAKDYSQYRISENQVGICSIALPDYSPSKHLRQKLRNLFKYHQFKGNKLITSQFLPRRNFVKPHVTTLINKARSYS